MDRSPPTDTATARGSLRGRVLALALGSVLAVTAAELALRAVGEERYLVWKPGVMTVSHAVPGYMPGVVGEATFVINEHGLRADPFADEQCLRVLALGGSTTECFYLDAPEAWPHLVQERLAGARACATWVGNAGRSGHTSRDHLLQTQQLIDQLPRLDLLLVLVGINDLHQFLALDGDWRPSPRFDDLLAARQEILLRRAFEVVPARLRRGGPPHTRTALWSALRGLGRSVMASGVTHVNRQDEGGSNYPRWRGYRQAAKRIRTDLPDLTAVLQEYRRNLTDLIEGARARGVRPVLMTQPTLWRPDLPPELEELLLFGGVGDYWSQQVDEYYSVEVLARGMQRFNQTLLDTCRSLGADAIDLAARVPKQGEYFYDDCHFNERGAELVADIVAERLSELLAAPPGADAGPAR